MNVSYNDVTASDMDKPLILSVFRELHPEKALSSIASTDSPNVKSVNPLQPSNAPNSILLILFGIISEIVYFCAKI